MLRGRALQIVDEHGRVRASIQVLASATGADGQPETAILRLADENGRPEVKLAASSRGSALSIVGATDANYLVLSADEKEPVLRAMQKGHERRLVP